jgi:prephenate dehydrogenase
MDPKFRTVTLVGVGLLGASLGRALKQRGLAETIRGVGRRQSTLDTALSLGCIDEAFLSLEDGVHDADLIVICTPANSVPDTLDTLARVCHPKAIITDVASTKSLICAHAHSTWSSPLRFVGSHPMAGSEKFGPEHADANLYEGAVCFVEAQMDTHDKDAYTVIYRLWETLGSKVIPIDPAIHDQWVACTSHIPHVAASALAQLICSPKEAAPFIGKGFKDTTRVAEGRPEIWRDICLTNPEAIAKGLRELSDTLSSVAQAIDHHDSDALDAFFEKGAQARKESLDS